MLITQRVEAIETIKNSLPGFSLGSETWPKLPPWLGETISQAGDSIFSRETDAVNLTGGKVNPFESRKEKKKRKKHFQTGISFCYEQFSWSARRGN